MTYRLQDVLAHCADKPELWHRISHNLAVSPDFQHMETPIPLPIAPVPDESSIVYRKSQIAWPFWARLIRRLRRPGDTGLGDTLERLIGKTRSERFKKWFAGKFGRSCGCTARQDWLNRRFPYAVSSLSSTFFPLEHQSKPK